jgi:DNA invertase Pin-like site-specific DNA recombinase
MATTNQAAPAPTRAVGYVRVSTSDQGLNGASLTAQRQAIKRECEARGWTLLRIHEDVASAKSRKRRLRPRAGSRRLQDGL